MMKDLYGRVMPSSKKQLNVKTNDLKKHLLKIEETYKEEAEERNRQYELFQKVVEVNGQKYEMLEKQLLGLQETAEKQMVTLEQDVEQVQKQMLAENEDRFLHLETEIKRQFDVLQKEVLETMRRQIHLMDLQEKKILRASNEAVWGEIFHDAICESVWLKQRTFYPGRWAAGYPYLYALYRCLNEIKPQNILEMGLGQTTRVIGQYAAYEKNCHHLVTEHDDNWINFFTSDFSLPDNTEIMKLNIRKELYHGTDEVTVYEDFSEKMKGRKFDLISIDAPFGGATLNYSRVDILKILPQCLEESFVILLDDYDRKGEKNMIEELKQILEENKIEYATGLYWGNKDTFMISSLNLSFLCTM